MSDSALAIIENSVQPLQKAKPRYTETENQILFESWWNPQKRRDLVNHLGRKISALRSQFCRLLKEKGLTNQEYYNMMQSKYAKLTGNAPRKRSREMKDIDRTIIEVFCKHQALGNSRAQACEELQQILGKSYTAASLKLRFYRLIKRLQYADRDLIKIGKELLEYSNQQSQFPKETTPKISRNTEEPTSNNIEIKSNLITDHSFFYQLSSLPDSIIQMEKRLGKIEECQRHQLDLRGFIEHLLAVERDLKREDKLMEEIQHLVDENESMKSMLEKDRERLKKREEELTNVYKLLNSMLADFMSLESVSKLASLGDFMHRLEITVDQFGNVLKSRRIG